MQSFFKVSILVMFFLASTFTASFAQVNWTKYQGNPVLQPGSPGAWDDLNVSLVCVILVGDTLHMWYDGNWDALATMNSGVGHATSVDGINWSKDALNPVLLPGQPGHWDSGTVTQVTVLYNASDSLFHMWYQGWGSGQYIYIGHATSFDGRHWTKDASNPVLSPGSNGSWDDLGVLAPRVILVDTTYHMWYEGWIDGSSLIRIGHATSPDPDGTWTKDPANPVLNPGISSFWDYPAVGFPNVIHDGVRFHLFYTGRNWAWAIGYAYSKNGSNWTKYSDQPVLQKGSIPSWDDDFVMRASVMKFAATDSLKMWYSGADNGPNDHVGYATALFDTSFLGISDLHENFPNRYVLHQNYPNPFNPLTTIEFSIPKTEQVNLKVYNILGQEVAILVSDKLTLGNYTYSWDASGFASGVYLYKLEAGSFIQIHKVILIK